jgi:zinc transporter
VIDLSDTAGLICGFRLRPDAPVERISHRPSDWKNSDDSGPVWLHFNLADARAQQWLANCERLPAAARDRLLSDDRHIGLRAAGSGLAGLLGDVGYEFESDPEHLGLLHVYVDEHWIVTARTHPLKVADQLRREFLEGAIAPTPLFVLIRFAEELGELFDSIAITQADLVDDIEDSVLKDRGRREGGDLGRVRRLVARLRRHVAAQRQALAQVVHRPPRWSGEEEIEQLRRAFERTEVVAQDLEATQERARLLQEEISNSLGEATNRNLYVLSIVTAIFMPITLVTGIFGMNVGGLPWLTEDGGFIRVMVVMVLTAVITLVVLHWRRFF